MKNKRKIISILVSIVIIISFPLLSISQSKNSYFLYCNKKEVSMEDFSQVSITPGKDETMLNFSWYSTEYDKYSLIKIWDDDGIERYYKGESKEIGNGYISNKVTVSNLEENTKYYYSYKVDNKWSNPREYSTKGFKDFSFIFMGDPQVGASYKKSNSYKEGIKKDIYNWNKVIKKSLENSINSSFIICAGDITNTTEEKYNSRKTFISNFEYSGFLAPNYLRSMPIVSAIGNHDKDNENFYNHFNMPNATKLGETIAGGDYYFIYNNAIFLFLNTNNLNINEHKKFIEEALEKEQKIKWKIVICHHNIYGCGSHSEDEDIKILRKYMAPIFETNNIDLVLCGHDHIYSRSYILKNNKILNDFTLKQIKNNKKGQLEVMNNPKGIIYITGGSSTGSKCYKSNNKDKYYIKAKYDKDIPIYTIVNVFDDSINITTYEVNQGNSIDNKIIIQKTNFN